MFREVVVQKLDFLKLTVAVVRYEHFSCNGVFAASVLIFQFAVVI